MKTNKELFKMAALTVSLSLLAACAKSGEGTDGEALSGNIVGGVAATDTFQKENGLVALVINTDEGQGLCSGTLISRKIVLTAAHCLAEPGIRSVAVIFATDVEKATEANVRFAANAKVHESFSPGGRGSWNDIALIKLNEDAPADFKVARLPASDSLKPKTMLTQAGFGKTEASRFATTDSSGVLRKVDGIEVISKSADAKELNLRENGKGSCNGDSGGPAFVKSSDGKLTQVGVNSRGNDSATCIGVGIFTSVAPHMAWIRASVASLSQAAATPPKAD